MSVAEAFVASTDRSRLFLRSWRPGEVGAVLAVVHEPGSDGAGYAGLAHALALHRIATYAIDLRGCGRSPGSYRRIGAIAARLADLRTLLSCARQADPAAPIFMLGHGAGAALACHYALRHEGELDGIICTGARLGPAWKGALLRRFPRLSGALSLAGARRKLRGPLAGLAVPLLLLHGSEDPVAPLCGSEYLHRYVASRDKTLLVFEGHGHELINGPGHALVRDKIWQWIQAQRNAGTWRRRIGIEYINE